MRTAVLDAWPSRPTMCSGTPTMAAATLAGLIRRPARALSGPLLAGPSLKPYGITAVKNIIWYSESNVKPNTVVRFDPKKERFQTWLIPSGGGVVRNMMSTPQGNLWLACSGFNRIALVEVKSNSAGAPN